MNIEGSRIVVTGASSGIGAAVALDLASRGADVVAIARSEDKLRDLQAEAPSILPTPCDLTDVAARTELLAGLGEVDAVVNNAGVAWIGAFAEMSPEDIDAQLALNIAATVAVCRAVVPGMIERDRGHLVMMGSILGFAPGPPLTLYSATKAAVHAFTEGLRRELVGTDVRVSLVAPGPVKGTGALDDSGEEGATETIRKSFETFGTTPDEVAKAVRIALEGDAKPSTRTITVPRIAGLSRVAGIPGADWAMDQGFGLLRKAGVAV